MKKSSKNPFLIFFMVIFLGAGVLYYFTSTVDEQEQHLKAVAPSPIPKEGNYSKVEYPANSRYGESGKSSDQMLLQAQKQGKLATSKKVGVRDEFQQARLQQQASNLRTINEFTNLTQMKLNLPQNLSFSNLDVDEGIAALRGVGTGEIKDMTILASKKKVNSDQIVAYLNSADTGVPITKAGNFRVNSKIKIRPPRGSGIQKITIIESRNDSGVKAALITRADGQGNYLFLIKASHTFYSSNEGYLEQILGSIKAQ